MIPLPSHPSSPQENLSALGSHPSIFLETPVCPCLVTGRPGRVRPVLLISIPIIPIAANPGRLLELLAVPLGKDVIRIGLALHDLQAHPFGDVFCDVAVKEPRAGIVGLEGDDHVAGQRHHGDVAAGGIVVVEVEIVYVESLVVSLFKDGEVMAVEVHLRC